MERAESEPSTMRKSLAATTRRRQGKEVRRTPQPTGTRQVINFKYSKFCNEPEERGGRRETTNRDSEMRLMAFGRLALVEIQDGI